LPWQMKRILWVFDISYRFVERKYKKCGFVCNNWVSLQSNQGYIIVMKSFSTTYRFPKVYIADVMEI